MIDGAGLGSARGRDPWKVFRASLLQGNRPRPPAPRLQGAGRRRGRRLGDQFSAEVGRARGVAGSTELFGSIVRPGGPRRVSGEFPTKRSIQVHK